MIKPFPVRATHPTNPYVQLHDPAQIVAVMNMARGRLISIDDPVFKPLPDGMTKSQVLAIVEKFKPIVQHEDRIQTLHEAVLQRGEMTRMRHDYLSLSNYVRSSLIQPKLVLLEWYIEMRVAGNTPPPLADLLALKNMDLQSMVATYAAKCITPERIVKKDSKKLAKILTKEQLDKVQVMMARRFGGMKAVVKDYLPELDDEARIQVQEYMRTELHYLRRERKRDHDRRCDEEERNEQAKKELANHAPKIVAPLPPAKYDLT